MLALSFVLGAVVALAGCAAPGGTRVEAPEIMPTYAEVAERFNARIDRLDRLWASVNLTLRTPKEKGGTSVDRAEGYLQIEQPDRTSLSIMKLGETYFYFGSDGGGYWWFDLSKDERKVALYGRHAEATPELVAELGLPVHPRELLDLFAVTPLPTRGPGGAAPGRVEWDGASGLLRVSVPGMWGERVLWLDHVTMAPDRVDLLGARGKLRAHAEMGRYTSVPVVGDGRVPPKLASQYRVQMPESGAMLTMELYRTTNKPINPRAFDFEDLAESYGVDEVLILDSDRGTRE